MPLRLRRGTDTERQLITPQEGEPIYVTDTKSLWIGDGITPGGFKASGAIPDKLDDLSDIDLSVAPQIGQVLKWNGSAFVASTDIDTFGSGSGVVEGSNYRVSIVGTDSTIIVNSDTNTFTGNLVGNVSGDIVGSVFADDSTTLVDAVNGVHYGTFIGTFFGGENSFIEGDLKGSVLSDDSTLIIEGRTGDIVGKIKTTDGIQVFLAQDTSTNSGLRFNMFRGTEDIRLEPNNFDRSNIVWNSWNEVSNDYVADVLLGGYHQSGGGGYFAVSATDTSDTLFNTAIEMDGVLGIILLAASDKINVTAPVVSTKYVQFGSYTTTERNALTPAVGMVIYNTTTNVFEGYQNTSGTTLEWVALS